ncbi:MAG TPA: hypothetical protein VL793_11200 [Patescibacteria group bacterium]|nr:hypothetical protein [Patescibacteria group bacterium]
MKTVPLSIPLDKEPPLLLAVDPWPRGALTKAYGNVDKDWERVEAAATAAQGSPSWDD